MSSQPKVLYMVLCDGFSTEPNSGKKTLLGVFDKIAFKNFPSAYPSFTIAIGLEGGQDHYELGTVVKDPSNKIVFRSPTVGVTPKAPYYREDVILQINGFKFEGGPGRYVVDVTINNTGVLSSHPIFVEQVPAKIVSA